MLLDDWNRVRDELNLFESGCFFIKDVMLFNSRAILG